MTFGPVNTEAPFIDENIFFSSEFSQFLIQISDFVREVAMGINQREICAYTANEILTGSTLFSVEESRILLPVYRIVIDFGALPNSTSKSVPHGLPVTSGWRFIKILVGANNPIATGATPYATAIPNLESRVDITLNDVVITTTADYSAYTSTTVILEYVKNTS